MASATPVAASEERVDKMPAGIPFIISNEFAERFCFYGINSILTLYMVHYLNFTDAHGAAWQSYFKSGAYFFPVVGAIVSDVFWGKFRTIMWFSLVYAGGCIALALAGHTPAALALSLFLVAFGTGGIKPCVSTNVGDQFTAKNQHLIERAFSWFYLAINAGSSISIFFCPVLLNNPKFGPVWAFGMPAAMMLIATLAFWAGRNKYATVAPAGKAWLKDVFSADGVKLIVNLLIIYFFVSIFWMLWDQSNGNTWTLQASSSLVDKNLGFGLKLLPAQVQVVNGLFILILAPTFSYWVYPFFEKFTRVTPLRKIGVGLFVTALSFVVIAWIEKQIQNGHVVSVWWQIFAYGILTAGEVLVSITALEFSYKQAPLRVKSFIMALFLLSTSLGNLLIGAVNDWMVKPVHAHSVQVGAQTWVSLDEADQFVTGQKIDFTGENGLSVIGADGKTSKLEGTYLVSEIDTLHHQVRLMDVVNRAPVQTTGSFLSTGKVSTYKLVGPGYFWFFIYVMCGMGVLYIFVAMAYKEKTYVRTDGAGASA
jgi:POT family proton-dependent oligopeptide transporter